MSDVFEIADILVSHALAAYQGDIAIIAYYGSYAKGLASSSSDLDIFYIPDEGKANSLRSEFVLDDLPYDFWPVSWQFAEDIAHARSGRLWSVSASLIADAEVLYHRSQADLDRFNDLKVCIEELTQPANQALMLERALTSLKETLFQLGNLQLAISQSNRSDIYAMSWQFITHALNTLALLNQTYFSKGWGANHAQLMELAIRPENLGQIIGEILMPPAPDMLLLSAKKLAGEIKDLLFASQQTHARPTGAESELKYFYYYIFEYKNKVLSACRRGDAIAAGYAAYQLQDLFSRLLNQAEYGLFGTDINVLSNCNDAYQDAGFPDLLSAAAEGDLKALARQAVELDSLAKEWLTHQKIDLNILQSKEDLLRFLRERDPIDR